MIRKINRIKRLGLVFSDYTWKTGLPLLKQFNLVYGWNGSGKTTFSRLFRAISDTASDIEYEIEDAQDITYKQGETFPKNIRVFNQDYIQNNVKIVEGRANSISILLGEENKDLVQQIETDLKLLNGDPNDTSTSGKISLRKSHAKGKDKRTEERGNRFTNIAKTIGAAIGGNALRDYRKPQAERDFLELSEKQELHLDELQKYTLAIKQESLPVVEIITPEKVVIDDGAGDSDISSIIGHIQAEAKSLFKKTVESEVVSRLLSNADIAIWVEEGIALHSKHASSACEYCLQEIPAQRIKELGRHFNDADRQLKSDLDSLSAKLRKTSKVIENLRAPDSARVYVDLQDSYKIRASHFDASKLLALTAISKLLDELKDKKSKTTEKMVWQSDIHLESMLSTIGEINSIITTHNGRTADFDNIKKAATKKLKSHYLSTIYDEVKGDDTAIQDISAELSGLDTEIAEVSKRISDNRAKISSKHRACDLINSKLTTFLGHKELTFTPDIKQEKDDAGITSEIVTGYKIMRGDQSAKHLSEGEKTAIAFVYFVVHLGDEKFDTKDGIIVIDDPISSLDSNSLYQAFSFLKNAVSDASQVFVLTHSFEFLKLLINWRRHGGPTSYYMIKNEFPGNERRAYLDKMDKELCEYESEYHYLFKLLKQLRDAQDDSIAKAYPIPNIARKVWDTFLLFSVPSGKTPHNKTEELKEAGYDNDKLDAIYKFTNDQSHITGSGFNPALVPETKKVVNELFEMMETIAPTHFKIIDRATN